MRLEPDKEVRILVTHSECDLMRKGDTIFLKGPLIDNEKSASICITALLSIYPTVRYKGEEFGLGQWVSSMVP